jgi:glycosyltransferase involved in cell wall biosynthesis
MRIVVVNFAYDERLRNPEELLDRYHSLTGWCEALAAAGPARLSVVQRFRADATRVHNGIEYHFYDDRLLKRARLPLRTSPCHRLVRDAAADIVHVNGLDSPLETALLRRALPVDAALVVQDHASGDPRALGSISHRARRSVRRRLMQSIDGFLFTAAAQAESWQRAGLISSSQPVYEVLEASTLIKPIDYMTAGKETGVNGDPALLWVGRLNANKDPLTVLDGFERCLASVPAAKLSMIYTDGELVAAVRDRLASAPALSARVALIGNVPYERMASFYSAADIFVVGSHHEGSGYALLEACACGLVPVVTDIPAFRTITNRGSIGGLWPVGDSSALADAITWTSRLNRRDARDRVLAHFERALSWSAVGHAAMRAYRDALARRRAKTA